MKATGYNSVRSWWVAAACGLINLLTKMPMKVAGLLFVAFLDRYDTDREMASWPFTLSIIMKCTPGPLIAYLAGCIGLRYLTLLGVSLAALGIGLCYFAENIIAIIIFFGFVFGTGLSFATTMMPQIIKQHFDKNYANPNGLTLSTACLGAFTCSPLLKYLINEYGLSGSFLIMFAVMLNGIPIAYLLRNPRYKKKIIVNGVNNETKYTAIPVADSDEIGYLQNQKRNPKVNDEEMESTGNLKTEPYNRKSSTVISLGTETNNMINVEIENYKFKPKETVNSNCVSESDNNIKCILETVTSDNTFSTQDRVKNVENDFTHNLEELSNPLQTSTCSKDITEENALFHKDKDCKEEGKCTKMLQSLTLFKDPVYLVIMLAHSTVVFAQTTVYTVMMDMSRDKGIDTDMGIYIVMALPASELAGSLGLGWITDKGFMSNSNFITLCMTLFSLGCGLLVWSSVFVPILVGAALIGSCSAGASIGFPGLIYRFIDEDKQPMAISSRMMFFTPLSFTIAPMIGYFRDTLGSYDGLLYLQGTINLISGVCMFTLPCLRRSTKEMAGR